MQNVVPFKLNKNRDKPTDCHATELIRRELSSLSSNEAMIDVVIERMQSFISVLDYDLSLHVEVNERTEEAMLDLAPAVQDLQTRFSNVISEIIAERILQEVARYYAEKPVQQ